MKDHCYLATVYIMLRREPKIEKIEITVTKKTPEADA